MWPADADALVAEQRRLAGLSGRAWTPPGRGLLVGGCWVCFPRGLAGPGDVGDPAWGAAVLMDGGGVVDGVVRTGFAGAAYVPGLLALRIGPVLEAVVRALERVPDVLLVDATGRDHPRRAGLAIHLGAELGIPTVGLTHRPLRGEGGWPADRRGATSLLRVGDEVVGCWMRTRPGTRPLVVHPGWRTDLDTAVDVVARTALRRTPEPLRRARRLAREARAGASVVG